MKKILIVLLALVVLCLSQAALASPILLSGMDALPETTEEGFLPEGSEPVYCKDHSAGIWFYLAENLRIEITRVQSKSPALVYYIADIVCAKGTSLGTATWNTERPGRTNALPQDIAQREHAIFAMSGDFYSYRVSNDRRPGVIIRDGEILYSKTYSKMVHALPNLATMAFYPSGKAEVNEAWEMTAKDYVKKGATTVLAFGPILIRDDEPQDLSDSAYTHKEPRACIGIMEPGHYIGLLVEGRKSHSEGATLEKCAEILLDMGCSDAINLDGGNTAAMLFMGESVQLAENGGVDHNDRAIPDILCVGTY